jgi:hypothetical protein
VGKVEVKDCLPQGNRDPLTNVIDSARVHSAKHSAPKTLADARIMISIEPVREDGFASIRHIIDPDSNVTELSDSHSQKHHTPKTSSDAEIIISTKAVLHWRGAEKRLSGMINGSE